jgi:hypothetical protein
MAGQAETSFTRLAYSAEETFKLGRLERIYYADATQDYKYIGKSLNSNKIIQAIKDSHNWDPLPPLEGPR